MEFQALFAIILLSLCISGAKSATFTFTNNCPYTIWPGTLTGAGKPLLTTTGFQLNSTTSFSLDVPDGWSGRFWGRSNCSNDNVSGKFTCEIGDCGSGQISCNGAGGTPPTTLIELTLSSNGDKDYYDVSLVDGFNLPISLTPQQQGGAGSNCSSTSCTSNVNLICPSELAVKGSDGSVIACKSACLAFNQPEYCCTDAFSHSQSCQPSKYSEIFKKECPQAYSYAFDDTSSTFTCAGRPNYLITFCP